MTPRSSRRALWALAPILTWSAYTQAFPIHGVGGALLGVLAGTASALWWSARPSSLEPPPKPPKPGQPKPPPPPPGPGPVSRKGGYPAGDKPPSELKPPPAALTTPHGCLVAGTVVPTPHDCKPVDLWREIVAALPVEGTPSPNAVLECACGQQWEWTVIGWQRKREWPPPGLHPNREDIALERRARRWAKVRARFGHRAQEDPRA
jgi:hypothetical protein